MKKFEKPKKPILYYYGIALLVLMLFNFIAMPYLAESQIKEVDYGKFMTMTEKKNIGQVEIQDNQILFTDKKGENIYKTGVMPDEGLTERLYESGAEFSGEIVQESSPALMFLLSWILPLVIFIAIGQLLSRHMKNSGGGGPSLWIPAQEADAVLHAAAC